MRVITRNSVYSVRAGHGALMVARVADLWGREVKRSHAHLTHTLVLRVGSPMETEALRTSPVVAVVEDR